MYKHFKQVLIKFLQNLSLKLSFSAKIYFFIFGIASTLWFLFRVLPKPSRASYPCMRAAAPVASSFVMYLLSLASSAIFLKRFRNYIIIGRKSLATFFLVLGLGASVTALIYNNSSTIASETPLEVANSPIGVAQGINPGRVVWVYNPDATNSACTNAFGDGYFMDTNTNQDEVDRMLEEALKKLTSQTTITGAWDAVFKYHNQTRGKGSMGYDGDEPIFIKINATSSWVENINSSFERINNGGYAISETSPQIVLAVLRQLVYTVGVPESMIYIGDPSKHIYQDNYTKWHNEFPNVHYLDHSSTSLGREKVVKSTTALIKYSDRGTVLHEGSWDNSQAGASIYQDTLYTIFEEMEYMINIPNLKAHERAGITMFGKNHFGSHTRDDAKHLHGGLVRPSASEALRNTYGLYRVQVDIMSHRLLGKKNLFYLMDALYCSDMSIVKPSKWQIAPFNNDWTSSIFLSQDPVAIESVGFDFLYAQYDGSNGLNNYPHLGAVDDYLHQLADSTLWPDGITYDPENDGISIGYSQGVHEHWNNAIDKEYSRNLGTGMGIELIQDFMPVQSYPVTGVSLNTISLSLTVGGTSTLTATVSPANATDISVSWSSSNTSVATVSSNGEITAVAVGSATIIATTTDGGKTATCTVTVENTVPGTAIYIDFGPNDGTNGNITSSPDVNENYWNNITNTSTSAASVNLVDSENSSSGAFINITSGFSSNGIQNGGLLSPDASLLGDFAINTATQDYFFTETSSSFAVGGLDKTKGYVFYLFGTRNDAETRTTTYTLQGSNTYSGTLQTSGTNLGGTSYNGNTKTILTSDVITPDDNGQISVSVTRTEGSFGYLGVMKIKKVESTSVVPVTDVSLNTASLSLANGSTSKLTATISPSNATNQTVSWYSDNNGIATVDSNGTVTAASIGSTFVVVTTHDGNKTDTCTVTNQDIPIDGITLNATTLLLMPGETSLLTETISPSNTTNQSVIWSSGNLGIASVGSTGIVTAISAGSTTITATTVDGSKTATCVVNVLANLALNKTTISSSDENEELTANYATDGIYSSRWSSEFSDPQWINVDLGAIYNVTRVKLYWEGSYAESYKIQVSSNASDWTDVYSTTLGNGATDDLSITSSIARYVRMYSTVRNTDYGYSLYEFEVYGYVFDNQAPTIPTGLYSSWRNESSISLVWEASSDNVGVAGYDIYKDGTYTASSTTTSYTLSSLVADKAYTFTIKAKDAAGNYSAASDSLAVSTTIVPVTGVTLSPHNLSIDIGNISNLMATVSPADANNKAVSWSSGNTSVATIDNNGKVMAVNTGTTFIVATTQDGFKTDTCMITVTNLGVPVTGVSLNKSTLLLRAGETTLLNATISPSDATNQNVTWSSGNLGVAIVDSTGVVTAVFPGSTTITVTSENSSKTATCFVRVMANLAINKTTISSSDENEGLTANYATDGSYGSRWGSLFKDPQWIYVDLGSTYNVTNVKLFWEGAYATSYKIQVSNDDTSTWTDVFNTTSGDGGSEDLSITPSNGRYVRMYCTARNTEYGYSLYEFEIFGDTIDVQAPTVPTGLNSPSRTQTSITLAWVASTDNVGVIGYDVFNDGVYAASTSSTSCTIDNLVGGTTYTFTVKAKDVAGNYSAASNVCTVSSIIIPVTGVSLSSSSLSLSTGSNSTLTGAISPSDATNQTVSWSSSNANVATVDGSGVVTAVSEGSATITVTTTDGAFSATCDITASDIEVTGVVLSPATAFIEIGETVQLTETVSPSDATNQTVSWSSNNTNVATVDESGIVTAVAPGSATITATTTDGAFSATCDITVSDIEVTGVVLSPATVFIEIGETVQLTETVSPSDATNQTVSWSSNNVNVATVDESGIVTAVAPGSATITVITTDGAFSATCDITVSDIEVTGVVLSPATAFIEIGETVQLTETVSPSNATNQTVSWSSNNVNVATVDESGIVTAVAPGSATITVTTTDGAFSATCDIRVSDIEVTGVVLSPATVFIEIGETVQLTETVSPSDATNQTVSWSSNNVNVATVDESGVVTAVASGSATITVTTTDGTFSATCDITVSDIEVTGVVLSPATAFIEIGETVQLTETVSPSDATNQTVSWSSNNVNVATVDESGIVTAVASGLATITVTTTDGAFSATCDITVSDIEVTGVVLSPAIVFIEIGETVQLTETVSPSDAPNQTVSWSSGNSNIATVDANGTVRAVSFGTTTITATTQVGNKTATCVVHVLANLALNKPTISSSDENEVLIADDATDGNYGSRWGSLFEDPQWIYVDLGSTYTVTQVKLFWEGAYATSYKIQVSLDAITWTDVYSTTTGNGGSDDLIVTASNARYVRMYGTVRNTDYGYSLYEFEVYGYVFDNQAPTIPTGLYSSWRNESSISLVWEASTDNVGVAGYDIYKDGTYTASSATTSYTINSLVANRAYTFTIKAKDAAGNYSAASDSLVVSTTIVPVAGVTLSPHNLSIDIGNISNLMATVSPAEANNKAVSWSSGNTSVATIDNNGKVMAVNTGTTFIVATTQDGFKTDTCMITVTNLGVPVTGVSLNNSTLLLRAGETKLLNATISPSDATNQNVTWSSGNLGVAIVDSTGSVTAVFPGSTTITVTSENSSKTATCFVKVLANLALNKTTISSSDENEGLTANYATDGSYGSRWGSLFKDPQWIYVDLGSTYNVTNVKLFWEGAYATSYKIQVSNDDTSTWTDVFKTTTGNGGSDDLSITPSNARYVRMYGGARNTEYGYSLYEFEIFGDTIEAQPSAAPTEISGPSQTQISNSTLATAISTYNANNNKELEKQALFDVYPNPADNTLFVKLNEASSVVLAKVFSIHGDAIKSWSYPPEDYSFDISSLAKGIYILMIQTELGVCKKIFVKL